MKSYFWLLVGALTFLLVLPPEALASPVVYKNGKLRRSHLKVQVNMPEDWESYSTPCDYPPEHEQVLGPIVDLMQSKAPGYSFDRNPFGGRGVDGSRINCGNSATHMIKEVKNAGLLPPGWEAVRVNSHDIMATLDPNGTSHTCYMIIAPDGTGYLMDSYFFQAEITKMDALSDITFEPAENIHNIAMKGYVKLFGNVRNTWIVEKDDWHDLDDVSSNLIKYGMSTSTSFSSSYDPNDIYGPAGAGEARYIAPGKDLTYTIAFENKASAGLAAVDVRVDCYLDPESLDLATLRFGAFTIGARNFTMPDVGPAYSTLIDLRPAMNLLVKVTVSVDSAASICRWVFNGLDPQTLDVPEDFEAGFLPPNVAPPQGEGSVSFQVRSRPSLQTGDAIRVGANIWFDLNDPIATPVWTNTIDATPPSSHLEALPKFISGPEFGLQWSGDDAHSGVAGYTIHVSPDDGPFVLYAAKSESGERRFQGQPGHTFSFYCVAQDAAGNEEPALSQPQVTVTVPATEDINRDLSVDALDVQLVINGALDIDIGGLNADVNGDGTVDALDVQLVINAVLGIVK